MLRFLKHFIRTALRVFPIISLAGSKISHNSWKRLGLNTRVTSQYLLNYRVLRRYLGFYLISNAFASILAVIIMILLIYIRGTLVQYGYGGWLNLSPISLSDVSTFLSWVWSLSGAWLVLVTFNHWNEVSALLVEMTASGTISSYLGSFLGLAYVVVIEYSREFFSTLLTHPTNLLETKAVYEFILLGGNMQIFWSYIRTGWLVPVITQLSDYLNTFQFGSFLVVNFLHFKALIMSIGLAVKDGLSHLLWGGWTLLSNSIASAITPQTGSNFIQPIVDGIMKPVASALSVTIILWIIKWLLGIPF
jgi:hypothetical protein